MKKTKFLVLSESYNPNIGGYVVLHKLCDELNRLGYVSKLVPTFNNFVFSKNYWLTPLLRFIKERLRRSAPYITNPKLFTPMATSDDIENIDEWVVIYPETICGNPLNARKVVRWFLHHPGFHNKNVMYGFNELYFKYHSGINIPASLKSATSDLELRIVHYPLDLYNMDGANGRRRGSAYAIRKGAGKKIIHDLSESILIDGKSHEEISKIFKSVERFYSYDPYTAYSTFAVLCGCDSIIVSDENVAIDDWIPDANLRAGIAYGEESIIEARNSRNILIERVRAELLNNSSIAKEFVGRVNDFFDE